MGRDPLLEEGPPGALKWVMVFIDRVGFPIVAFCIMAYMCFVTLDKVKTATEAQTRALIDLSGAVRSLQK